MGQLLCQSWKQEALLPCFTAGDQCRAQQSRATRPQVSLTLPRSSPTAGIPLLAQQRSRHLGRTLRYE